MNFEKNENSFFIFDDHFIMKLQFITRVIKDFIFIYKIDLVKKGFRLTKL